MRRSLWFAAITAVSIGPAAAVTPPSAGIYHAQGLYTSVTASGGASCPAVGTTFNLAFTYPGPGQTGAVAHAQSLTNGSFEVGSITFSETPLAGKNHWDGSAVTRTSSSNAENRATFRGVLQFFDSSSFLATLQWNEDEASGGTCDETIAFAFVKA